MIHYAAYDPQTGRILRTGLCAEADLALQGTAIEANEADASLHYVLEGALVDLPARPGPGYVWMGPVAGWVDQRSLSDIQDRKWEAIKAAREAMKNSPIEVGGITVDSDAKSRENIMGAVLEMQATGRTSRTWTLADNTRQTLTLSQLVSIGAAIADRTETLQNLSQDLRQEIYAATTPAEVEAVAWPA